MASEYMKWKAQQEIAAEIPKEPEKPMSKKDRLENWLRYHWLHLVIGAVLLWIVGSMLWNVLGFGQVQPDYRIAYVGQTALTDEEVTAIETAFAALGTDVNGDGRITASLTQYGVYRGGDTETALYYNYASDTLLIADIESQDSYFFLTDDPKGLQRAYQILANPDGSLPEETDYSIDDKVIPLADCPALFVLTEYETLRGLSLARRGFYGNAAADQAANDALWNALMKGATK